MAIALRTCIQQTQQMFIQHLPYARDFYTHYRRHYPILEIRKLRLRTFQEIAQGHKASQGSNPSLLTSGPERLLVHPAGGLSNTGANVMADTCTATVFGCLEISIFHLHHTLRSRFYIILIFQMRRRRQREVRRICLKLPGAEGEGLGSELTLQSMPLSSPHWRSSCHWSSLKTPQREGLDS